MTIKVVNKYAVPENIYCGRGSALGNPFYMHTEKDRDIVCDKYENYFNEMLKSENPDFHGQLNMILVAAREGADVNLGCFCAPKRCHCDTIKKYIDNKLNNSQEN